VTKITDYRPASFRSGLSR